MVDGNHRNEYLRSLSVRARLLGVRTTLLQAERFMDENGIANPELRESINKIMALVEEAIINESIGRACKFNFNWI